MSRRKWMAESAEVCMGKSEREREREWATAINAVLMHYIKIPGTDKVSHGVQCAKRDKGEVVVVVVVGG